jgi:hypothetical protein
MAVVTSAGSWSGDDGGSAKCDNGNDKAIYEHLHGRVCVVTTGVFLRDERGI